MQSNLLKNPLLQTPVERRVEGVLTPLESFIRKQGTAGILLILAVLLALLLTNSKWETAWLRLGNIDLGLYFHHWNFGLSVKAWISDGLLALFFF